MAALRLTNPLREFIAANADWLTVFQLPTYAPDLNPQEGIWSLVKRDLGNLTALDLGHVTRAVKRRLKMLQYQPQVIDGCLAGTGPVLDGCPVGRPGSRTRTIDSLDPKAGFHLTNRASR